MATESFESSIKVDKKTVKSFDAILNSKKKIAIRKDPIAKDVDVKSLRKFLGK